MTALRNTTQQSIQLNTPSSAANIFQAAKLLVPYLEKGTAIDAKILRSAMETAFGASDSDGAWLWKDAYEAAECAIALMMIQYGAMMKKHAPSDATFLAMIEKLALLAPSHTKRSDRGQKLQQFSTPLPLSAVMSIAADISNTDLLMEPSAGTGLLAIFGRIAGASLCLNEICETRSELLSFLFPDDIIHKHDASSIDDRLDQSIEPSVILMNPPFSVAPNVEKRFKAATATHILSALSRLKQGGRLVAITGESFNPATAGHVSAFNRICEFGEIVFSKPIAGQLFARHGTTIDTRITVIDKFDQVGSSPSQINADCYHPIANTIQELLISIKRVSQRNCQEVIPQIDSKRLSVLAIRDSAKAEHTEIAKKQAQHPFDHAPTTVVEYTPKPWAENTSKQTESVYEAYDLQAISIENAIAHPTELVQSAAMASVAPPFPSHQPKLLSNIIDNGLLSGPQLESVIYAGEAHSSHLKGWFKPSEIYGELSAANEQEEGAFQLRKGWFLGDGTGCGKGRQVAGIILDNWLNGRKRSVWVSKSDKLLEDARRDWMAIGGRESDIVPLAKYRQGGEIKLQEGILFVTYATLRSAERNGNASRLEQVVDWLGDEFDGVIAFDEGHAMANAAGEKGAPGGRGDKKASQQGRVGLALQNLAPNARILYVSATGATVVSNLAYASRLGLWSTGDFPFKTRSEFVASMEAGGIAAMEIISRDLKALGLYLARALSYEGVEYEMLVHDLTPEQTDIYDSYAKAFQVIHNNLEKALEATGITTDGATSNKNAKSAARSAFESNKQRFFNHLITAMKCPSVINSIKADIEAGHSAVIQVVSTSEALMERRLAEIPSSEWSDLHVDITPREYVMDYLAHSFPVQLFEPYEDENGEVKTRPAYDNDGNPIICREAARRRDNLIEQLGLLAPVQSALDQILWHFGTDCVAEVTGRKRRIVKTPEERLMVQNRPSSSNLNETQSFMDDEKQILIFSDAGGTGRSYHADLSTKNQRLRVHYLLESGWRADNAIQGLGRTNRTNQAQPPLFRPCATNVKGEKRFLSTIARRLDTLGAITKGQRETGGQNMFRAEDNLESSYARAALRQFFYKLRAGQIETCSYQCFQDMTGLTLDDADGCMKENLPPIQQFLNRCLALTISMQNTIFDAFGEYHEAIIDDARKSGRLDAGLETLHGEKFEIADRTVIYQDPRSGSKTTALTIDRTDRNHPRTFKKAMEFCQKSSNVGLYWNKTSKRAAIKIDAPAFMSETGQPILRVELIRPMGTEYVDLLDFMKSNWEEATDKQFEDLWREEVTNIPEFTKSKLTFISGLLLPIWDRLPSDNMRIYRVQADDGERAIGRLLTQDQLISVYNKLGLNCEIKMAPDEVMKTVIDQRSPLSLINGFNLRRSLVMGQARLELVGADANSLQELKKFGCFTEVIQWKTRLFVPTDNMDVLSRILEQHPIGRTCEEAKS